MNRAHPRRQRPTRAHGFSIVEMLIALTISATLLVACLGALDAAWRTYKVTTESASTHVVSRIITHRVLAMVRTGEDFGPFPADFLDPTQNPVIADRIQFRSAEDAASGANLVTEVVRVADPGGGFTLRHRVYDMDDGGTMISDQPLLDGVQDAIFTLEYEPGPRLVRATLDITVDPLEDADIRAGVSIEAPTIRLVASAVPQRIAD